MVAERSYENGGRIFDPLIVTDGNAIFSLEE